VAYEVKNKESGAWAIKNNGKKPSQKESTRNIFYEQPHAYKEITRRSCPRNL